jgi:hypothetical protein
LKNVTKIEPTVPQMPERKKVAAYARVSMESERLQHSLSAQVSYYSEFIQKHTDWQYVGVYADNGISGTGTAKRDEFQHMLDDCEAGKIDIMGALSPRSGNPLLKRIGGHLNDGGFGANDTSAKTPIRIRIPTTSSPALLSAVGAAQIIAANPPP